MQEPIFTHAVRNTIIDTLSISIAGTLLAYALAAAIWRAGPALRTILIALVIIPFWTSVLVKIVAWNAILRDNGLVNTVLLDLGLIHAPLVLLHAQTAVILGMTQYVLPFAVFPILGVLMRLDPQLEQAADSLGAGPLRAFCSVILPLSAPGIIAAFMLIFRHLRRVLRDSRDPRQPVRWNDRQCRCCLRVAARRLSRGVGNWSRAGCRRAATDPALHPRLAAGPGIVR